MTSISPLSSWNAAPARSPATAANGTQAPASPANAPSTVVNLSAGATPAEMAARAVAGMTAPQAVWENPPRDAVSSMIAKNLSSSSFGGRFNGLGAALLSELKGGARNVAQSVQQAALRAPAVTYGAVPEVTPASLHGNGQDKVSLNITTRSGVAVTLSLDSQGDGLAVQMSASGELSDDEVNALSGLSDAFQQAIDGMAQRKPQIKLDGLMQYDQSVLASVDLHAEVKVNTVPEGTQTLAFRSDDMQRTVSASGPAGTLNVKVDPAKGVLLGGKDQQAKALASYMKQFDQAASRGHGDTSLMAMFKDAFSALHASSGTAGTAPADTGVPEPAKARLYGGDSAILTGLADFTASVSQTTAFSNPMRSSEKDTFKYDVSQSTTLGGSSRDDHSVRQQQSAKLSASYHMSLVPGVPLALSTDSGSQNYTYHQIEDTAESDAQLAYKEGKLARASLKQSSNQSTQVTKYFLGKLQSDVTTPTSTSVVRDLMPLLGPYQTGSVGKSAEQQEEARKHSLLTLGDDVLLQSYPGQSIAPWQSESALETVLLDQQDKAAQQNQQPFGAAGAMSA